MQNYGHTYITQGNVVFKHVVHFARHISDYSVCIVPLEVIVTSIRYQQIASVLANELFQVSQS